MYVVAEMLNLIVRFAGIQVPYVSGAVPETLTPIVVKQGHARPRSLGTSRNYGSFSTPDFNMFLM